MTDQPQHEWGPWVEHDGLSVPVRVGQYVAVVCEKLCGERTEIEGPVARQTVEEGRRCWIWSERHDGWRVWQRVVEYRIRKPRGMAVLEETLREIERAPRVEVDA